MIRGVLEDHYERLKSMEQSYKEKLESMPRGNIRLKKIRGRLYPYLDYREDGKMVSKYLNKLSKEELNELQFKLEQHKKLVKNLREVKRDCMILEKALKLK
jgi:hypothetical protein